MWILIVNVLILYAIITIYLILLRVLLFYLNLIVVLLWFIFMVHFYGNITVIVLENDVHNGTNVLEEYIIFHITHIDGY